MAAPIVTLVRFPKLAVTKPQSLTSNDLRVALARVSHEQRAWALSCGLRVDDAGYLEAAEINLFAPMSPAARTACERGAGGELRDRGDRPAKMRALVSSSALAINVFDYWTGRSKEVLSSGLGRTAHSDPAFEVPFRTVMGGTAPHLDVVVQTAGPILAIESKYAEWLRPHRSHAESLAPYLRSGRTVWADAGLPECQRLATELASGDGDYQLLDVPQLLKHALGLTSIAAGFELMVLFHDPGGDAGDRFRLELGGFAERCGRELGFGFHVLSYQEMIGRMRAADRGEHTDYLRYLTDRYGSATPEASRLTTPFHREP